MRLNDYMKSLKSTLAKRFSGFRLLDFILALLVVLASIIVLLVIITYVMATQQRLSSYITPIPLTQKQYAKGEIVSGYFDGQKIYNGTVVIVRQLACNDGYLDTLIDLKDGDKYIDSISPARKIDGNSPRKIAEVPSDVTEGASCTIAFDHRACIPYLFGCYEQHYTYVSLPFIVSSTPTGAPINQNNSQGAQSAPTRIPDPENGLTAPAVNTEPTASQNASPEVTDPEDEVTEGGTLYKVLDDVNKTVEDATAPITKTIDGILNSKKK